MKLPIAQIVACVTIGIAASPHRRIAAGASAVAGKRRRPECQ
ncbi:MAG: hypothetical protein ABI132_09585 [Rhodanobacteraceae bacterium]